MGIHFFIYFCQFEPSRLYKTTKLPLYSWLIWALFVSLLSSLFSLTNSRFHLHLLWRVIRTLKPLILGLFGTPFFSPPWNMWKTDLSLFLFLFLSSIGLETNSPLFYLPPSLFLDFLKVFLTYFPFFSPSSLRPLSFPPLTKVSNLETGVVES